MPEYASTVQIPSNLFRIAMHSDLENAPMTCYLGLAMMTHQLLTSEVLSTMKRTAVRALNGRKADAEDLVADVCVRILSGEGFDPTRGTMQAYACMMVKSMALNRWNRENAVKFTSAGPADDNGDVSDLVDTLSDFDGRDEVMRRADERALAHALATLTTDERTFYDAMADGETQEAAGALLGWSKGYASKRRKRMEEALRAAIEAL